MNANCYLWILPAHLQMNPPDMLSYRNNAPLVTYEDTQLCDGPSPTLQSGFKFLA